jgi:succinyl-diaminopimelate desuccinylase
LAARYREFGYAVEQVEANGLSEHTERHPRVNVIARRGTVGPRLHFNGHFDVVPAGDGWSLPPFDGVVRGGRLYGRGTADQKAGLAASLFAVEALRRAGISLTGTVEQSATVDEESGGFAGVALLCQRGLIAAGRTDYVVITEPLGHDRICLGHRGVYWFEVEAHGRTAHGSMPSLGLNAADLMAELISVVNRELKPKLAARVTAMPVEPPLARRPSLNLNSLHGGQLVEGLESPCVPDRCRAVFDRRFIVEETFEDVRAEISELVDALNGEGRFELRDLMVVQPVLADADSRLVQTFGAAIQEVVGRSPDLIASPGTYDQKHVVRIGGVAQCVAYGPGILELAHQPDEYVEIEHLIASTKVMALAAIGLLGWQRDAGERGRDEGP